MKMNMNCAHKSTGTVPNRFSGKNNQRAFSLLEVIVAAAILALGLLSIVKVFPYGIEASHRAEDLTQATLLAQTIFEGMKNDPVNFPVIPGAENVVLPLPGNAYDDDFNNVTFTLQGRYVHDLNGNLLPDKDYDGLPELDALQVRLRVGGVKANGIDDDGDGIIDDDGDSGSADARVINPKTSQMFADGDVYYDPEFNIDEEYADGIDNDGDNMIDEDCRLASVRVLNSRLMLPLLAGDRYDNDGDGEDNDGDPKTPALADGIDNDGDGEIDEGIDEEIWDGRDNDKDGRVDEDCRLAAFPFAPARFPAPYDRYAWQIRVGRIPDNGRNGIQDINGDGIPDLGDGFDNDGDGFVDEEMPDGLDMDFRTKDGRYLTGYSQTPLSDGLVDEDCIAAPLPDWRRVEIVITWGGDGIDNDEDLKRVDKRSEGSYASDDIKLLRNRRVSYGAIEWGIDEEKLDGIDDDFDGQIDEDTYKFDFTLIGFINLRAPSESFTLIGGQPRGIVARNFTKE